jgi:hypothetical protein
MTKGRVAVGKIESCLIVLQALTMILLLVATEMIWFSPRIGKWLMIIE